MKRINPMFLRAHAPIFLLLVIGLILPFLVQSDYVIHFIIISYYYVLLSASWNLLSGYSGQLSLAQAGFAGLGAYTSALTVINLGLSPAFGILLGSLVVFAIGTILGFLFFKMRGTYLALATLGFAETCRLVILALYFITKGDAGLPVQPLFKTASKLPYYYVMFGILFFSLYTLYKIINSRFGLFLRAIREDEDAALAMGIDTMRYKIFAFAITGLFAGLAGGFYGHYIAIIHPNMLRMDEMGKILVGPLFGGLGTFTGPIIGAFLIQLVSEYVRDSFGEYHLIILGLAVIFIMKYGREGLVKILLRRVRAPKVASKG